LTRPLRRSWRLVDDVDRDLDAAAQMAADEALLDEVAAGAPPALRLYRWSRPALSLGRFQPDADADADACARFGVEVVRRPTGGRGVLHGGDLTYAVAMPRPAGPEGGVDPVYRQLAAALIAGLARLGVEAAVARHDGPAGPVCFAGQQGADLRVGDRKLCGSAQVRRAGAVLQHGSVLRRRLPFDETHLLVVRPGAPVVSSERLRAATVTLDELGTPSGAHQVARALVEGFAQALDLDLRERVGSTGRRG
jgi:lipoyl(octanoyl) transferase